MKVFIWGDRGNMGRRYSAILKYLGHEVVGCDVFTFKNVSDHLNTSAAVIVATNTDSHLQVLHFLATKHIPVLCEKPLSTNITKLEEFLKIAENEQMKISMVSQYDYLMGKNSHHPKAGDTSYDFYQSGADGLAWDCINIIKRAKGKITLKNESPIWRCQINGIPLDIGMMNHAYVEMIENWLSNQYKPQYDSILAAHKKVLDYIDGKFN